MSTRSLRTALVVLATAFLGVAAFAQTYTWQHFAGDPGGPGAIDGNGTTARLFGGGLVRDSAGNVYAADTEAHVVRRITPAGEVTTFAGLAGSFGRVNGTDADVRFNRPIGLAIDQYDNVFVADCWNGAIRKITPAGIVTTFAGGGADKPFYFPEGVAVDRRNGTVYVADTLHHTIRKIVNGTITTLAGTQNVAGSADGWTSSARFNEPSGIAVDTNGDIYVADTSNSKIRKITPDGFVTTVSGPGFSYVDGPLGSARFNDPQQIAFASNRDLFIADQSNDRVRKVSGGVVSSTGVVPRPVGVAPDETGGAYTSARNALYRVTGGTTSLVAGLAYPGSFADGTGSAARFRGPYDADTDSLGNLYVADANNCSIRKITPEGVVTTYAGVPGECVPADGDLFTARFEGSIYGLDVDDSGNIYVAETWRHVIRKIAANGTVTTIAGTGGSRGSANGAGSAARFYTPYDVAAAPNGDVYVADTGNHLIRRIAADGAVTTLAGS
ncbi:MAG TPA: SMP-30/gluconolactonase/LRE family protein, partial [Thermoanaerobaculia bacterium]